MKDNITTDWIQPYDFDLFIGMDVDKKSIVMTIMDHDQLNKSLKVPYDPENVCNYFSNKYAGKRIIFVYEAGPTGWGLFDEISKQYSCLVADPGSLPAAPNAKVKTNRLDSIQLARLLRGGQIKGIRVPSEPYRRLRHLIQLRDTFVKQATASKQRIKALLLMEGLPFPSPEGAWSLAVLRQLKSDKQYDKVRFKLNCLLESFEFTHRQQIATQREIRRFCGEETELRESIGFVKSIPGIGQVIATEMIARIGDWRLLKNAREIGAFLGLTPCENSTGEDIKRGRITKKMRGRTRNKLIEGSWAAIRQDGELLGFYRRIKRANPQSYGGAKAIVAVARKLTSRIYRVLKDRRSYEIRVPVKNVIKLAEAVKKEQKEVMVEGTTCLGGDSSNYRTKKYRIRASSLVRT